MAKVFAMLRPHGRISYQHSDIDMEIIKTDIESLIDGGADGFVFGALTADRSIDTAKCCRIVELARGLPVTFHRAFDMTIPADRFLSVDEIAGCGFRRILSSGFESTAEKGAQSLAEINDYIRQKGYNLVLMPGCGVTIQNAAKILDVTGCQEFHSSAKIKAVESILKHDSDTPFIENDRTGNSFNVTSRDIVQQLVNIGKVHLKS